MDLSVIIVSWNTEDLLKKCLASVLAAVKTEIGPRGQPLTAEIFVVDNHSQDQTVAMVKKDFPAVKLIANEKNLGFSRANNQALKQASGDYVLWLNPDTEILPGTLEKCLAFSASRPDAGVVGCRLLNSDGSLQPSVRRFPTWRALGAIFFKLPKFWPHLKTIDRYLARDFDYEKTQIADQVMGAFMLIKKTTLARVGQLNEKFFLWFEEVDFCRRVRQAGQKVYYFSEAAIIHHGGRSFRQELKAINQWRFFTSALKYFFNKK